MAHQGLAVGLYDSRVEKLSRISISLAAVLFIALIGAGCAKPSPMPVDSASTQTCSGLGKAQGATVVGRTVYIYGDSDTGVVREYNVTADAAPRLVATGRTVLLTRDGKNLLNHPTGLAVREGMPVFFGNTVTATKEGRIYCLDLDRALKEGTLDHAVLNETIDDLAVQGTRPEYVRMNGRVLLATSDYGPGPNFVRFYDPQLLRTATKTSDPGVLVARVPCGPWVQNLHWIERTGSLALIQNAVEGRQWRLTFISDLEIGDYRAGRGVQVMDIAKHEDELEGYTQLDDKLGIFITSSQTNNVTFAR